VERKILEMNSDTEIINNLKKVVCDIRIDVQKSSGSYKQKEIFF
jgi:hypothetical protein